MGLFTVGYIKEKVSGMKIIQNHDQACLLVIYRKCSEMDVESSSRVSGFGNRAQLTDLRIFFKELNDGKSLFYRVRHHKHHR